MDIDIKAFNEFNNQFPVYNPADLAALSEDPRKNRDTKKLERESLEEVLNNSAVRETLRLLAKK